MFATTPKKQPETGRARCLGQVVIVPVVRSFTVGRLGLGVIASVDGRAV